MLSKSLRDLSKYCVCSVFHAALLPASIHILSILPLYKAKSNDERKNAFIADSVAPFVCCLLVQFVSAAAYVTN